MRVSVLGLGTGAGSRGKPAPIDKHQLLYLGLISIGSISIGTIGQPPLTSGVHPTLTGSQLQLPSHHASNSSRCSSSVIENSSSNPSWLSSFSVILPPRRFSTRKERTSAGVENSALRGGTKQSNSCGWLSKVSASVPSLLPP